MTDYEWRNIQVGDVVRHKSADHGYVVTAHYGDRITAVRTVDLTNRSEWDLVIVQQSQ